MISFIFLTLICVGCNKVSLICIAWGGGGGGGWGGGGVLRGGGGGGGGGGGFEGTADFK